MLASPLANGMLALGLGLLTAVLLRRAYRRLGARKKRRPDRALEQTPRPATAWSGAYADASARIERERVELHEQSREAAATIDNKLVMLQQLIAQSQQQIDRLETLLTRAERLPDDR